MNYDPVGDVPAPSRIEVVDVTSEGATTNLDHAVEMYVSGEPYESIKRLIDPKTLYVALAERGIEQRRAGRMAAMQSQLPEIVSAYNDGTSMKALAEQFGYSRETIRRQLARAGVQLRSASEQQRIRMGRLSQEERSALAASAHAAVRGKRVPEHRRLKRAVTLERASWHGPHVAQNDLDLAALLAARGIQAVPQKAVGPYNLDLAIPPSVAVEVFGGGWHQQNARAKIEQSRVEYVLDAGWHLIVVVVRATTPIQGATADYVAAFVDLASSSPSAPREHRVIRGDGKPASGLEN